MKAIKTLVAATVAVAGLAVTADAEARGWHGHRWHGGWHGPRVGLYIGAPLLFGSYYWGSPYYHGFYDGPRVVYREVIREPEYIEVDKEPAVREPARTEGAPTQGPAYMNYCASAKAYYPKVTTCPEAWKFLTPTQ